MAAGTMLTAAVAAAMMYYVMNRRLAKKAEEDDGDLAYGDLAYGDLAYGDSSKSSRSDWKRWFTQRPALLESMITLSETLRFTHSVGLKCGGRMEPSESDSAVVSNGKDQELSSEWAPSSTVAHHPQPSDLNHTAEEDPLDEELQNKLDLKGGDGHSRGWETNSRDENVNDKVGGDDVDDDGVEKKEEESRAGTQHHYPLRSGAEDCAFYMKTGTCKFGFNCKFNHPIRRKNQAVKEKAGEREELAERSGQTECKYYLRSGGCKFGKACKYNHTRGKFSTTPSLELNFVGLPIRLGEKECPYYMRTGSCKIGENCKFNHPEPTAVGGCDPPSGYGNGGSISLEGGWSSPRTLNETSPFVPMMLSPTRGVSPKSSDWNGYQDVKEKAGEREELAERSGQTECKYYLRSGGCKFGKACKYNHTRGKFSTTPSLELNFVGLPIRLGEKECPYYMRTGSCKIGENCKFNHPDPTAVGGCDPPSGYCNGGSISLEGGWSSPRTLNETSPFVPMMLSPTRGVSPKSSDCNGYQAPVYLSESSMHPPSTYVMNNPAIETNIYMHRPKQMAVEEFPERPGEPECSYFLKTGDCKFKSNCKFHHPIDQNVCSRYSRYGICKFRPACKFDPPISSPLLMMPELGQQSYTNSASIEVARMGGSVAASDASIQQSV